MPKHTYIAVIDKANTQAPFALQSLADVVELTDGLTMISVTKDLALFSGDPKAVDKIATHFLGQLLIEVDQDLTPIEPLPHAAASPAQPATNDDTDDKDDNEIVQF